MGWRQMLLSLPHRTLVLGHPVRGALTGQRVKPMDSEAQTHSQLPELQACPVALHGAEDPEMGCCRAG